MTKLPSLLCFILGTLVSFAEITSPSQIAFIRKSHAAVEKDPTKEENRKNSAKAVKYISDSSTISVKIDKGIIQMFQTDEFDLNPTLLRHFIHSCSIYELDNPKSQNSFDQNYYALGRVVVLYKTLKFRLKGVKFEKLEAIMKLSQDEVKAYVREALEEK